MKRRNFLKGLLLTIPAVAGCRAIKDPTREVVTILPSPMSEKPEYLSGMNESVRESGEIMAEKIGEIITEWQASLNGKEIPITDCVTERGEIKNPSYMTEGDTFMIKSPYIELGSGFPYARKA